MSLERDPPKDEDHGCDHASGGSHDDRLIERDRAPGELAEEIHLSALCDADICVKQSGSSGLHSGAQDDSVEQIGRHLAISERRNRLAWLCQIRISLRGSSTGPSLRVALTHCSNCSAGTASTMKCISAKPSPLNCADKPGYDAGMIGLQLKLRRHSRHRVDLPAQLRHEEAVHDP